GSMGEQFDLRRLDDDFYADPYPVYAALRRSDPVKLMPDGSYFLTRHRDVEAVYKDAVRFSSDKQVEFRPKYGDAPLYEHHTTSLVFNDAPLHSRVRRLIAGALTPRAIGGLEPSLVTLVDGLLDRIAAKGTFDIIEDFAAAIPVEVIGNLLGVPRDERGELRGWSLAILGALEPAPSEAQLASGNCAVADFIDYLKRLVAARRRNPGNADTDVLTRLIGTEEAGERLSEAELLHKCIFILNAGHETTTNLIGNGLHLLATWPAERARLLADPGLIATAIEEFLRFESSNQLGNRITTEDVTIGRVAMKPGTPVTLCIGAANRDPALFADPDRLDIARTPNRHLAFGFGVHHCAGAVLARLEGRVAIARFLKRFPESRLAGPAIRGRRARFRGFVALPASTA
ncbi:MAG TPA: cytochrome P450, partial [Stellaceae bacterium]|nr:cytochrome P450 [Stellaceae bacterium]